MREKHPLAGETVILNTRDGPDPDNLKGQEYRIEDWWINVGGGSWMWAKGNPACLKYAMRTGFTKPPIPCDDNVLYGKVGMLGHLIHESEIGDKVGEK